MVHSPCRLLTTAIHCDAKGGRREHARSFRVLFLELLAQTHDLHMQIQKQTRLTLARGSAGVVLCIFHQAADPLMDSVRDVLRLHTADLR